MELGEYMCRLDEFKAMSQPLEYGLDEFKENSASHRLTTFIRMRMNSVGPLKKVSMIV